MEGIASSRQHYVEIRVGVHANGDLIIVQCHIKTALHVSEGLNSFTNEFDADNSNFISDRCSLVPALWKLYNENKDTGGKKIAAS
jgi:hypothetical protein